MLETYLKEHQENLTLVGPLYEGNGQFKDPVIFVDGGAEFKIDLGISVGDNDSYEHTLDKRLPLNKDFSDLSYVLKRIPLNYSKIKLLGFLGGRRDHEVMNLGEVSRFLKTREKTRVLFDQDVICISPGKWNFVFNSLFSLFSFEDNTISVEGNCHYTLQNKKLKAHCSHGLSNVGEGDITIRNSRPLMIFLNLEKN